MQMSDLFNPWLRNTGEPNLPANNGYSRGRAIWTSTSDCGSFSGGNYTNSARAAPRKVKQTERELNCPELLSAAVAPANAYSKSTQNKIIKAITIRAVYIVYTLR